MKGMKRITCSYFHSLACTFFLQSISFKTVAEVPNPQTASDSSETDVSLSLPPELQSLRTRMGKIQLWKVLACLVNVCETGPGNSFFFPRKTQGKFQLCLTAILVMVFLVMIYLFCNLLFLLKLFF